MPEEDKQHQGTTTPPPKPPPRQHQHPNQEQRQPREEDNAHPAHRHHVDDRNNTSTNHGHQRGTYDNKNKGQEQQRQQGRQGATRDDGNTRGVRCAPPPSRAPVRLLVLDQVPEREGYCKRRGNRAGCTWGPGVWMCVLLTALTYYFHCPPALPHLHDTNMNTQ